MVLNEADAGPKSKQHDIPIDHLDFKYIETCDNVKELEKIYKVLLSGVEGKYPELENFVFEKIQKLSPNSRTLRKDAPIIQKTSIPKSDQALIDQEIHDFLNNIPDLEKKIIEKKTHVKKPSGNEDRLPPVRNSNQKIALDSKTKDAKVEMKKPDPKKSAMPKNYREWEKIEKQMDKEIEENQPTESKDLSSAQIVKIDKTIINTGNKTKSLVKELSENLDAEDDEMKLIKADQEKLKGNEAYNANSYDEAIVYYTRSIKLLPNAASYNNRAMTYIKIEKWDKAIEDCNEVLKYESENVKALLRRSTALSKKRKFEEAYKDIQKCVEIEPNNKKTQELKKQIEESIKKENDEKNRVKSIGGNRLKIEETDGSEDEENLKQNNVNSTMSKESKIESIAQVPKANNSDQKLKSKTRIKIAEVASDDEDEKIIPQSKIEKNESKIEEKLKIPGENISKQTSRKDLNGLGKKQETDFKKGIEVQKELELEEEKIVKKDPIKIDLPEDLNNIKEKAFEKFTCGQYGEAGDLYTTSIKMLNDLIPKTSELQLLKYYNTSLSIFYNNRATCYQKIGDFKSCLKDCDLALDIINQSTESIDENKNLRLKLLSKKANSFEMLEKFIEAFKEYETVMKLDSSFKDVQLSYNRLRKILSENGELNKLRKISSNESSSKLDQEVKKVIEQKSEEKIVDQTKLYEEFKSKGNDFVKNNDFLKASEFYTKCIELESQNPVAYLNRSLCYIKLNKPDEAISDSSYVLSKEKQNVKALFRRASANRLKGNFKLVENDLKELLIIEPNNQIAIKEMESIKPFLDKKNLIKELDDPKVEVKKNITIKKKIESSVVQPQSTLTSKPSKVYQFSKISNAYEFMQAWNSINPKEIDPFVLLLSKINPNDLSKLIGSKLDDEMLSKIIKATYKLTFESDFSNLIEGEKFKPEDYLRSLSKSSRFSVTKLFMDNEQKKMVKEILETRPDINDLSSLKKLYDL